MLYGTGPDRRRLAEAAGRHLQHVVGRQHLQHASRPVVRADQGRGAGVAGLVGLRFNTIGVSDGISMGNRGDELFAPLA